jgi:hypothetical protein
MCHLFELAALSRLGQSEESFGIEPFVLAIQ